MALVKIHNEETLIDFNSLEYLKFTNGWMGGQWTDWDVVKDPDAYDVFAVTGDLIIRVLPISVDTYGADPDMGKTYDWVSKRLMIPVMTDLGCIHINSLELPKGVELMYRIKLVDLDEILG